MCDNHRTLNVHYCLLPFNNVDVLFMYKVKDTGEKNDRLITHYNLHTHENKHFRCIPPLFIPRSCTGLKLSHKLTKRFQMMTKTFTPFLISSVIFFYFSMKHSNCPCFTPSLRSPFQGPVPLY